MKRIILNGANGYVGSNLIDVLLQEGYEVYAFVRAKENSMARERLLNAVKKINGGAAIATENLNVYDYTLNEDDYGIDSTVLEDIFSENADFFHFAASLKFKSASRNIIYKTNIDGTKNTLEIFKRYATDSSRFFFIGTAYSCGKYSGIYREKFYGNGNIEEFRNYYELSKRRAENIVKDYIDKGEKAHILRLSQVVGNKITGTTNTDYGIFDFAGKARDIATSFPDLTIRIQADKEGTQNLISINTINAYLQDVINTEKIPTILHLVSNNPIKNIDIIDLISSHLSIEIKTETRIDKESMNKVEKLIAGGMDFTGSYTHINLKFDTTKRDKVVENKNPLISTKQMDKMIRNYFHETHRDKKRLQT